MAFSEYEAMAATLEESFAASRAALLQDPDGEEKPVSGSVVKMPSKIKVATAEVVTRIGKKDAIITAVPVQMDGPFVRAVRFALTRPDTGTQVREAKFNQPVEVTPTGVYVSERRGRSRVRMPISLQSIFSGNKKEQKVLRSYMTFV